MATSSEVVLQREVAKFWRMKAQKEEMKAESWIKQAERLEERLDRIMEITIEELARAEPNQGSALEAILAVLEGV